MKSGHASTVYFPSWGPLLRAHSSVRFYILAWDFGAWSFRSASSSDSSSGRSPASLALRPPHGKNVSLRCRSYGKPNQSTHPLRVLRGRGVEDHQGEVGLAVD